MVPLAFRVKDAPGLLGWLLLSGLLVVPIVLRFRIFPPALIPREQNKLRYLCPCTCGHSDYVVEQHKKSAKVQSILDTKSEKESFKNPLSRIERVPSEDI